MEGEEKKKELAADLVFLPHWKVFCESLTHGPTYHRCLIKKMNKTSVCLLGDGLKHSVKVLKQCYINWELSLVEIQACSVGSGSTIEFTLFYLWGCKTNKRRSEVRGGEGRACLLAWSSLASHPLASCQLCCPSPSLSPLRQTGCQCRGSQHAPQNKHTHCQFLLSPYLSICRLSVSQV